MCVVVVFLSSFFPFHSTLTPFHPSCILGFTTSIQKKLLAAGRDGLPLAFKIISPVFILVAVGLAGTAVYQWFHLVMPMYGPPYTAFYFVSTGIGIFLVSQILLHYYNCIMVSPGSPGCDDRQCKTIPGLRDVDCDDNNYCKHCKICHWRGHAALLYLWKMCYRFRPPLPMDNELCWSRQSQVLLFVSILCNYRLPLPSMFFCAAFLHYYVLS